MSRAKPFYVLDSYALLAYLNAEPGQAQVQAMLAQAQEGKAQIYLCLINLSEVLYLTERRRGLSHAQRVLALVESLPLQVLDVTRDLVLDAAHIKAQAAISYADAFVAAVAQREEAIVLTGDPEFKSVEAFVKVDWLG
ncbi:MAG: type II toxin-antitoxin system VapC family toxin [Anaerolineales bacterium]|nr:type II toxin-antitoxin system VapC family toxin [Anaerolineales bacterium]